MAQDALTNSPIETEFRQKTRRSAELHARSSKVIPAGLTHDSRTLAPYPIHVTHAKGPRKWDADGSELVDYFGGHGALILGHAHPALVEAVQKQIALGTHWGSCHELEVQWAELINRLVPCAARVRFTASGTEATHLAIRLMRAFTGKPKIVRFVGHFHGWHDQVAGGSNSHFDGSTPAGVLAGITEGTILMPADTVEPVADLLATRGDIAGVMVEPSGAGWGQVPLQPGFLEALRAATAKAGVLLMFDEVVTGFRWSKGGAQHRYGITPDLCALAKIVAGGLPGGAVAGRADIIDQLDAAAAAKAGREKIGHQGTYNANPLCAAAAIATLSLIEREDICERAEKTAGDLRDGMRKIVIEEGVPWGIYGEASTFQIFQNPKGMPLDPASFDPVKLGFQGLKGVKDARLAHRLRIALIANGVDIMGAPGGLVSAVHGPEDVAATLEAFRRSVKAMKAEGDIKG
ncbi:MAG: aminotransferase class III-fold pyridoxal phosphate-dependent enzyme [Hyphomicrobiaceae bacterium]